MARLTGPVYVPAPNPVVPRYGLFQVATGPIDLPQHGRSGGLQYETATCALPTCYEVECQADHNTKVLTNTKSTIVADPFVVYSSILCSPVGLDNERLRMFLHEQLVAGEQARVEEVFSRQLCAQSPGLAGNAAAVDLTPVPGTAVDIVRAFSLLESWLYARYGLPGVLHVPASLAAYVSNAHLSQDVKDRGVWRTPIGTAISLGNYSGYSTVNVAPAAGEAFVYITGQVAIWRTSDADLFVTTIADVLNRSTNQLTGVMEREYVVSLDCFVAAVEVDISGVVA